MLEYYDFVKEQYFLVVMPSEGSALNFCTTPLEPIVNTRRMFPHKTVISFGLFCRLFISYLCSEDTAYGGVSEIRATLYLYYFLLGLHSSVLTV